MYFKSTYLRQAAPGRFSRKFLEKTAAGGQGTAYVNNWQTVLAAAESPFTKTRRDGIRSVVGCS